MNGISKDNIRFNPETDTYHLICDWSEETPSEVIVELVSTVAERDVMDLSPLYDAVDPEALDTLFRTSETRPQPIDLVSVKYEGFKLSLYGTGEVSIHRV